MTVYTLAYTTREYGLSQNTYLVGLPQVRSRSSRSPLLGALSDKLGRRPVIVFGTLFIVALIVPIVSGVGKLRRGA